MDNNYDFLYSQLINAYGEITAREIFDNFNHKRVTSFRVNTIKSNAKEIEEILSNHNISYGKVKFYENAYFVDNAFENDIFGLTEFKQGKIYIQSLSSMIPPLLLNPSKEDVLDMTAAPGSKTTEISALSNNQANVTACEFNKVRAEKLKYNINLQGCKKVNVMVTDSRELSDYFAFDKVLLDAPCSGSGTVDFSENSNSYFSFDNLQKITKTQISLLNKAIKLTKKGGIIVYSTCSVLPIENDRVVAKFINKGLVELLDINKELFSEAEFLPTELPNTLCIKPDEKFEGFFVAVMKKL